MKKISKKPNTVSGIFIFLFLLGGCGGQDGGGGVNVEVVSDVQNLQLVRGSGTAVLSWTLPPDANIAGVEIRRLVDGHYPASPADGVVVARVSAETRQVTDSVIHDPANGPASFYYTVFAYSASGAYSRGVRSGLYCDPDKCVTVPDLRNSYRLHSREYVVGTRLALLQAVWGVGTLPARHPDAVADKSDANYPSAQAIKELRINMDYGLTSYVRYYSPFAANDKLIIFHQGHRGTQEIPLINRLLQERFHVMQVSMLFAGYNFVHPTFQSHDDLAGLDRPMRFFLEPVAVGLNHVLATRSFSGVYMTGISGGGWTTVVYAALDPRINASYPVAGSYPFYLRTQIGGPTAGDFEQNNPAFYQNVSYEELYAMGAAGRRQMQFYNEFDECCFGGTFSNTFKDFVVQGAGELGGSYDIVIDHEFVGHDISDYVLQRILDDINIR
jgi:hypothetical protein